jgi:hypothetical protein
MRNSINIALALVRILGTVMIVLGLLFATGNALELIPVHMMVGIVVVLLSWALAAWRRNRACGPSWLASRSRGAFSCPRSA